MSTGFIRKLDPPHEFPFVTNLSTRIGRPIPFSELPAPQNFSFPISNSVSLLRRFTPKSIENGSTLLLWLDFGDKTSFDISNSIVTAIRDKGKDSKAITIVGRFSISSQNNLPVFKTSAPGGNFDGNLKVFNFNMRKTFTSFIVYKSSNSFLSQHLMQEVGILGYYWTFSILMLNLIYGRLADSDGTYVPDSYATTSNAEISIYDKNSPFRQNGASGSTIVPYGTYVIYVIGHSIGNTFLTTYRMNGVSYETTSLSGGTAEPTTYYNGMLWINAYWMYTGNFNRPTVDGNPTSVMEIAEYMLYDEDLSFSDVEKIEGYLAAKWGLQSSLPETHSFKRVPPTMI